MVASLRLTISLSMLFSTCICLMSSSCIWNLRRSSPSSALAPAPAPALAFAVAEARAVCDGDVAVELGCEAGVGMIRNCRPSRQASRSSEVEQMSPMVLGPRALGFSLMVRAWCSSSSSSSMVSSTTSSTELRGTSCTEPPPSWSRHFRVSRFCVTQKVQMLRSSEPRAVVVRSSSGVPACSRFTCRLTAWNCSNSPAMSALPAPAPSLPIGLSFRVRP
mmetsp:Transcript_29495/g.52766  ORF Transcript_29495/g.52766 Transcript_29495/m.52766 type:complete len:219 (-) Transcript_29495:59-715(-)